MLGTGLARTGAGWSVYLGPRVYCQHVRDRIPGHRCCNLTDYRLEPIVSMAFRFTCQLISCTIRWILVTDLALVLVGLQVPCSLQRRTYTRSTRTVGPASV